MGLTTNLVFEDDSSSKFWNIVQEGATLTTTWGRIGTVGQTQTKQFDSEAAALATYETMVSSKVKKGYLEKGVAAAMPATAPKTSLPEIRPMLAESMRQEDLLRYVEDDRWHLDQKVDGMRACFVHAGGATTIVGRDGQTSQHNAKLGMPRYARDIARLPDCAVDGEIMPDGVVWLFDVLYLPHAGVELTTHYIDRRTALDKLFADWAPSPQAFRLLPTARTHKEKATLALRFLKGDAAGLMMEGLMAKDTLGTYKPGKRSRAVLKCKASATIDCIVTDLGRDGKANIVVSAYHDGELIELGEVTALAGDGPRIKVGQIVEVKYLHCLPGSTRLIQPTYPKIRTDKSAAECTTSQLRFTSKEVLA